MGHGREKSEPVINIHGIEYVHSDIAVESLFTNRNTLLKYTKLGMPFIKIKGRNYFDINQCQQWIERRDNMPDEMKQWEDVSRIIDNLLKKSKAEVHAKAVDALEAIAAENDITMVKKLAKHYIEEFKR
ncbi:MAG TPA: hypothetical protein VEF53_18805 [Patescibacteria group bacterium]|nr:hypothetical protein [Patescibacteria group bacterium]